MRLRTQYILFIILIHVVTLVLSFLILKDYKLFFIASEMVILLSLFFSIRLYSALVKPLNLLLEGVEAIKDRDFNVKFLKTGKYEMDRLIAVYNKMIDELRKERRLQQEKHFFLEKLIQNSPTGIVILDFDGHISGLNPKAETLLGVKEQIVLNQPLTGIPHPLTSKMLTLLDNGSETITINGTETYKCHKSTFIDRGFQRHFILIEELTSEILKAEKNAYGKVIRMMAHEVNNSIGPINSILSSLQFYGNQLKDTDQGEFEQVLKVSTYRNQQLNKFMQNFAKVVRLPAPKMERMDLRETIMQMVFLFKAEAEKREITFDLTTIPNDSIWIQGDAYQLEQVLINVFKNALEAIDKKGDIKIELCKEPLQLLIKDNGPGIDPALSEQLFSPFFSTKKNGQGVGLTLAKDVLYNHQFTFSLHTESDGWTVFQINF